MRVGVGLAPLALLVPQAQLLAPLVPQLLAPLALQALASTASTMT